MLESSKKNILYPAHAYQYKIQGVLTKMRTFQWDEDGVMSLQGEDPLNPIEILHRISKLWDLERLF